MKDDGRRQWMWWWFGGTKVAAFVSNGRRGGGQRATGTVASTPILLSHIRGTTGLDCGALVPNMASMIKRMDLQQFVASVADRRRPYHDNYLAMYSSVLDAIVTDPALMVVPVDDHMVHRGDGVFEVFKCVEGAVYNLDGHMSRLERSAASLAISPPVEMDRIREIVVETVRAGGSRDCIIHLYVSRGPGSFTSTPADCPETQIYVTVARLKKPFMVLHPEGARMITSGFEAKPPMQATVKTCNYAVNAMMRREATLKGVDFALAFDSEGRMGEGAGENMGIVTRGRDLLFPSTERVLAGTTMLRTADLAKALVSAGKLRRVAFTDISRAQVGDAAEILVTGTTLDVVAVVEMDGRNVGDGRPGPVALELDALLRRDIRTNASFRTPVFA